MLLNHFGSGPAHTQNTHLFTFTSQFLFYFSHGLQIQFYRSFSATDTVVLKQINESGIPTLMKIHNHERYVNISLYNPRMMVLA